MVLQLFLCLPTHTRPILQLYSFSQNITSCWFELFDQGTEFYAEGCNYNEPDDRTADDITISVTTISACGTVNCRNCPGGTYNPSNSPNFCKHCRDGYVPNTGQSDCVQCTAVSFDQISGTRGGETMRGEVLCSIGIHHPEQSSWVHLVVITDLNNSPCPLPDV